MPPITSGSSLQSEPRPPRGSRTLRRSVWTLTVVLIGIGLVSVTNHAVNWSSSDRFCGQMCHSMGWAYAAYKKSPHYQNPAGVPASCGACHIPYDSLHATTSQYIYLLAFKADRGAKDFYHEAVRSIAGKEEWQRRRPNLSNQFEEYLAKHDYITCRGCHQLQSFGGPHDSMKKIIHQGLSTTGGYNCLHCHSDIGHVYADSAAIATQSTSNDVTSVAQPSSAGWYAQQQAAAGAKLYAQNCESCHGAKLEGRVGPALIGSAWNQAYGGAKLLTIWGEIHGPMAQYSGTSFSEQQSMDILAFLLKLNGLPSGSEALTSMQGLNRRLPRSSEKNQ